MTAHPGEAKDVRQLLVATDFSPASTNALARAVRLAGQTGAAIRVVHAIAPWTTIEEALAIRKRLLVEAQLMAEEMLDRTLPISATISRRRPEAVILRGADAADADLILLGGHGEPRFRDALLGTTASHVVRRSSRPVLIVQAGDALPYRRLMVAMDEPARAEPVLAAALAVAPSAEEIFAVHACDPPASPLFGAEPNAAERHAREKEIEGFLHARTAARSAMLKTELAVVATGEVSAVLSAEAFTRAPDLLVIGSHRHSPLLGSHAIDTLGWCRSDLLIVPDTQGVPLAAMLATAT